MVAYQYEDLGGISGVIEGAAKPYSKRSRDHDRFQNFHFQCDPNAPFSGVVHIQGSLSDPASTKSDTKWADIAQLTFVNEGGNSFLQIEVELASVRVVCKQGNYTSGRIISIQTMR